MFKIRKEALPQRKGAGKKPHVSTEELSKLLGKSPGEWFVVSEFGASGNAYTKRKFLQVMLGEQFEVEVRHVGEKYRVYARYVGTKKSR